MGRNAWVGISAVVLLATLLGVVLWHAREDTPVYAEASRATSGGLREMEIPLDALPITTVDLGPAKAEAGQPDGAVSSSTLIARFETENGSVVRFDAAQLGSFRQHLDAILQDEGEVVELACRVTLCRVRFAFPDPIRRSQGVPRLLLDAGTVASPFEIAVIERLGTDYAVLLMQPRQ